MFLFDSPSSESSILDQQPTLIVGDSSVHGLETAAEKNVDRQTHFMPVSGMLKIFFKCPHAVSAHNSVPYNLGPYQCFVLFQAYLPRIWFGNPKKVIKLLFSKV